MYIVCILIQCIYTNRDVLPIRRIYDPSPNIRAFYAAYRQSIYKCKSHNYDL